MGEESGQRQYKPMFGWLIAVIGLLIAVILGWAMMAIGAGRLAAARKLQAESEARLMVAVDFAAKEAMREAQSAQVAINRSNWGEAGANLAQVNDLVSLMEQVAPEGMRSAVGNARGSLSDAQRQVGTQPRDAAQSVNTLITQLDGLREKKQGQ